MGATFTETVHGSMKQIKCEWTADSTAEISVQTTNVYDGKVELLVTVPGTPAPDPNWDLTVEDENGLDVLNGSGANRSATATQYVQSSSLGAVAQDKLTFNIGNVDVGLPYSQGVVYLYIR